MASAKEIVVKPISSADANMVVKSIHYSGKVVPNSQLHFGVFLNGKCGGAMQFGPSMVKDKLISLVKDTGWNEFIELNRMAFADWLPRNSESRAIGYALRFIKKNYPQIKWVVSFSDATQCGDGIIYRASGFKLTGIKRNNGLRVDPRTGEVKQQIAAWHLGLEKEFKNWQLLDGFQLRYIYFIDPQYRAKLTVKEIPFTEIDRLGIGMYKGKKRAVSKDNVATGFQSVEGGAIPTTALHTTDFQDASVPLHKKPQTPK